MVGALRFVVIAAVVLVSLSVVAAAAAQPVLVGQDARGIVAQGEAPQQPEQTPGTEDPGPLSPWLWGGLIVFALVGTAIVVTVMRRNRPRAGRR